ncbi:MAG: transcriptional repressor [Phycisphaerales bacterium]|nr:transcriptional repressor [Phycisphaerales bacterium]NNM26889.1 transcriptional repressor [Phycisphaerales bacterium]
MARSTRQRAAILATLEAAGRPLSPGEIHAGAARRVPGVGVATVYRNIKRLVVEHTLTPVNLPGAPPRYELVAAAERHHHHFRCDRCDAVYDVDGCPGGLSKMLPRGFRLRAHDIVLYGLCSTCGGGRA